MASSVPLASYEAVEHLYHRLVDCFNP